MSTPVLLFNLLKCKALLSILCILRNKFICKLVKGVYGPPKFLVSKFYLGLG